MAKNKPDFKLNAPVNFLSSSPAEPVQPEAIADERTEDIVIEDHNKPVEQEFSGIEERYQSLVSLNHQDQPSGKTPLTVQISKDEKKKLDLICMALGCTQGQIIGLNISDLHRLYKKDIEKLVAKKLKI